MNHNENQSDNNKSMQQPEPEKGERLWNRMLWYGLGEGFIKIGTIVVTIILCGVVLVFASRHYLQEQKPEQVESRPVEVSESFTDAFLPYYSPAIPDDEKFFLSQGLYRISDNHTNLPMRARYQVQKYTVQENDTVIGIGEQFNLSPSTILWGNPYTLSDDPHALRAGMEINILPVDGVYYEWHDGDGLNGVADVYKVTPEDIIDFPANGLSRETIGDYSNPNIKAGTWLVIPGGSRAFVNWSAPLITRENPAVASIYGPGACQAVMDGPLGSGTFVWPTSEHWISGYNYNEATNHRAIDIAGSLGNPVYAADAGVIVYAGWNNHGYGNVVMIDHGNGWQTLYAHLDSYNVGCGYYVFQGDTIASLGTTGNSSGPHLHYEMRYNGTPMNPNNFY
ncbi:MAG: peptidoglycan DD-metalloendopeptidase family protein [Anaerolineaceae bacterium]|nr:peptidoglycan DD-metalloendopeptidase family protein [Anaerolineaceae bacterium]